MSDEEIDIISDGSSDDPEPILLSARDSPVLLVVDDGVGSPGSNSDDVVIVESGDDGILAADTDSEASLSDDERGREVEQQGVPLPENNPVPTTSIADPPPAPDSQQMTSGILENTTLPSSHPQPSSSTLDNVGVAGPSMSGESQNTSLQDFQTPIFVQPSVPSIRTLLDPNESVVQFRLPKRRRLMSPEKSNAAEGGVSGGGDEEQDDEGDSCSICFEPWTNSGNHRLSSLKCGHLFGMSCIEKWLKGQGGKCPQCNEKAKIKDVRVIYAKTIKMMDTSEKERALRELEHEKTLRRKADLDAAEARLRCQQHIDESRRLRDELDRVRGELSSVRARSQAGVSAVSLSQPSQSQPASQLQQLQGQFTLDKSIKIWEAGQCRLVDFCASLAALVISQPSSSPLFPGFGIKKLSAMDFKTSSYLTLHTKAIRGISFHPTVDDGVLLSGSLDKTVKLTSMTTSTVVQTYNTFCPVWSVEWNANNQNYFYAGQQNGTVLEFDMRNTSEHVQQLNAEGSKSPVVALQYLTNDVNAAFRHGGLIVGQLDRTTFHQIKGGNEESRLHILPLEGNLTNLHLDPGTRHLLASFRPTAKHPSVRHQLCELSTTNAVGSDAVVTCNVIHTFHGGRAQANLAKTMLRPHPADDSRLLVVAGDESSNSAHIWDTATSRLMQRLPCEGMAVDFSTFTISNTTYLTALTERTLKVHRWC